MSGDDFSVYLQKVAAGERLDVEDAARAFGFIMEGRTEEIQIAAFVGALASRKPVVSEITGAAQAMRALMKSIAADANAIDLCGTGGDGHGTLNISTAVSFVVAAAGIPVAKHGNRAASSKSGAADTLEALGVKIDLAPAAAELVLAKTGIVFLFAQTYHPAMRFVGPVRRALGFRTIFNLLGPLASPARVRRQLTGVFAEEWITPYAETLRALGASNAMVVHGKDGLDELTTTDTTYVATLKGGIITRSEISPEDAGLPRATLAMLRGGDSAQNADALKNLLAGETGAYRDIVLLNSAAALMIGERAATIREGVAQAAALIDSGAANAKLAELIAVSNEFPA